MAAGRPRARLPLRRCGFASLPRAFSGHEARSGATRTQARSHHQMAATRPNIDEVVITAEELPLGCLASRVVCPTAGAIATFIGTTRDNFEGKQVVRLEVRKHE